MLGDRRGKRENVGMYGEVRVSEKWMWYAILTSKVIFRAKTSLDVFSLE